MHDWEEIGYVDPLFGVASVSDKRKNAWDESDFFEVGKKIVNRFLSIGEKYQYPKEKRVCLDFGCGVGRLLRFSSAAFEKVIAVDISEAMIERAKKFNSHRANISYSVNQRPDLKFVEDRSVDLLYTFHVLQHIPEKDVRINFLKEFQRVLKVGGLLVFHIPVYIPLRNRIQIRRRLYATLKRLGFSSQFLMNDLGFYPIHMKSVPKKTVLGLFNDNFKLLETITHTHKNGQISLTFYYAKIGE